VNLFQYSYKGSFAAISLTAFLTVAIVITFLLNTHANAGQAPKCEIVAAKTELTYTASTNHISDYAEKDEALQNGVSLPVIHSNNVYCLISTRFSTSQLFRHHTYLKPKFVLALQITSRYQNQLPVLQRKLRI
jgi:hypothetical protein